MDQEVRLWNPDFLDFGGYQNVTGLKRKSFGQPLISRFGSGIPDFLDLGGCRNLIILKENPLETIDFQLWLWNP